MDIDLAVRLGLPLGFIFLGLLALLFGHVLFSNRSGWGQLFERYPATGEPPPNVRGVSGRLGELWLRGGLWVGWDDRGVYINVSRLCGRGGAAALLPWEDIELEHGEFRGEPCTTLTLRCNRRPCAQILLHISRDVQPDTGPNAPSRLELLVPVLMIVWMVMLVLFFGSLMLVTLPTESPLFKPYLGWACGVYVALAFPLIFLIAVLAWLGRRRRCKRALGH